MKLLVSGVYVILCLYSEMVYVGESGDCSMRLSQHLADLRKGSHDNKALQSAWDTLDSLCFEFEVIECVKDRGERKNREAFWIGHYAGQCFNRIKPEHVTEEMASIRKKAWEAELEKARLDPHYCPL